MMKNRFLAIVLMAGLITFAACNKKPETVETTNDSIVEIAVDKVETATPEVVLKTVEGTVKSTNHGKDGYTAELETAEGIYFVTISHANLTDHEQYRDVKVGDQLKVTGDSWTMEGQEQITVRVIE